jgi:glycosyl transferase family 10 (putative fucosyltransferase)
MGAPLILFFNPFFAEFPDTSGLECRGACEFTHDRARMAEADAVVIHLPTATRLWEVPKYPGQLWVALSLESDVTVPLLRQARFMRHVDLAMTYRRDADIWWPYVPPRGFSPGPAERVLTPRPPKRASAPAVLFQSTDYDRCGRNAFAFDLMKKIRIDSYGKFLNNRRMEGPDLGTKTKLDVISGYKFCVAFENSRSVDYVTEKFFEPLIAGSVPVYRGAPNVEDFAPGEKCFINADDFSGPAELADYLNYLDGDAAAYEEYFKWKLQGLRAGFQTMIDALSEEPLCRLCDVVAARTAARRERRGEASSFVRPLYFRRWQLRGLVQRARSARAAVLRGLIRRRAPDRS